ncbi:MAG TPA: hypothetical protein VNJ08_08790 [Bacteriovoracaceae bacterium]|nr:hypothetical protein [Bacteriovoracaceae bacterium]
MPPVSKGRPATYSTLSLKQEWKDYKAQNPKGTKREFARIVGLSYSRIKALLNDHPSEMKRKKIHSLKKTLSSNDVEQKSRKPSGLMFEPF